MKAFLLITGVALSISLEVVAQDSKVNYYPLQDKKEKQPADIRYRYTEFLPGEVYYKNGNGGTGRLNYNLLVQEIHFIDETGDTLALDFPETVKYLTIGKDTFYFNKGIIQVTGTYNDVRLGVKDKLVIKDSRKIGAYGMENPGGSIDTYNTVRVNQGTYQIGTNANLVYGKERDYYLILKEKQFLPLNWSNLAKAFPSKKDKLADFASEHSINLNKEEDIRKLLAFCGEK